MTASKIIEKLNCAFIGLERRPRLAGVLLAVISIALFGWLQRHPTILDSDAFYHAKMTQFLSQGILVKDFPWLPFTILADYYADHHFLYHVILVPFVWLFDPLIGMKVAIVVLGVAALLVYFWALRRFNVIGAFWWTILAATSWPFLFRMNLVKALPLSLIIWLVGVVAIKEKKWIMLSVVSAIYVWTYNAWPMLLVVILIYSLITLFLNHGKNILDSFLPLFFALLGNLIGLVFNPYFPNNLWFSWKHIVGIGFWPTNLSYVGREWMRFPIHELFVAAVPLFATIFLLLVFMILFFITKNSFMPKDGDNYNIHITISTFAILLFFFTTLSQRYVEYFIPMAYLTVAIWASRLLLLEAMKPFIDIINYYKQMSPKIFLSIFSLLTALLLINIGQTVSELDKSFKGEWPLTRLQKSSRWLKTSIPPNSIVYNVRWDDFPALFYFASDFRYVSGLDIRFFNKKDKSDLAAWERLYKGTANNPAELINKTFGSNYVFASRFHTDEARKMLEANNFPIIYQDDEATVYAVP